ncbi:MAG: tetratricopeptide (TPR) repeat protein [Flavobacteriales bacterium]|jgi:tetratricopeptide (TPR) repeat protein
MISTATIPSPTSPTSERGGTRLVLRVTQRTSLDAGDQSEHVSAPIVTVSEFLDVAVDHVGTVMEVCDYTKVRVYKFPEAGKVLDSALMADVHHRHAEMLNRTHVTESLEEAGSDPVAAGMTLGLARHAISIGEASHANDVVWDEDIARIDGRVVYERSAESWPVDEAAMQDVARFLRRTYRGHPAILLDMATRAELPKRMVFTFRYPGRTNECVIEVLKADSVETPSYDIDGLAWMSAGLPIIGAQIAIAMPFGVVGKAEIEQFDAQLRVLLEKKQWVAALLTVFEVSWTMQGVPQNFMEALQRIPQENRTALRVMKIAQETLEIVKHEAKMESAIEELRACAKAAGPKAYCLDVLIGNLQQGAARHERAIESYLKATHSNPGMCVVYHNMGNSLATMYQFHAAYQCWDFAYFLAPQHPVMKDVQTAQIHIREQELKVPIGRLLS